MSKAVKKVASIALPVLGTVIFPGIGTAIGAAVGATGAAASAIGGAALGGIGGAIGGGGVKGALKGAALGGVGGYVAGGGLNNVLGTAAGTPIQGAVQPGAAPLGTSSGSGILGGLGKLGKTIQDLGVGSAAGNGSVLSDGGGSILGSLSKGSSLANLANSAYGAYATDKAAAAQEQGQQNALQAQQDALTQVRGDLEPFRDAGTSTVGGLTTLVNDPNAQKDFITANPFYQSLAKDATDKLYANQAAKGKLGSGGTAQALQNSLLLLGNSLLNDDVTRKSGVVDTGVRAAGGTGSASLAAGSNLADLNLLGGALKSNSATSNFGANKNLLRSILTL